MDKEDKMLLAAYVSLGAVIGGVVLAVALAGLVADVVNAILLILFFVYLVWLGDHASGASIRARKWYREKQEHRFYRRRMSTVIQKRVETVMRDLQTLTSGEGSIEKVAVKFFERPADARFSKTEYPNLEDVFPDFFQVRDLLLGNQMLLSTSFRYLDVLNADVMCETRRCLCDLGDFINRYVAWVVKVIDQLGRQKEKCHAASYANSKAQYSSFQRNYSQLVADLDSLMAAYNNAASTDPSVCSECTLALTRRALDDFP